MLGTDPSLAVPSAVELLHHPWFPVDGVEHKDAMAPMPLKPGHKVAIGPPVRPEVVPKGLPPMVPKLSTNMVDSGMGTAKGDSALDSGSGPTSSPWVEMPDGSQALCSWLMKRTSERNALGLRSHW